MAGLFCEVEWWGVEVGHAPTLQLDVTAKFACLSRLFVLLIKIGGWGNVQVVGGIPPTGKGEEKCTGCTS